MTGSRAVVVKDVDAQAFIKAYAEYLKKAGKIEIPKYVDLIKLAHFKELAPMDNDWYYYRCGMPQWVLHVVSARVSVL